MFLDVPGFIDGLKERYQDIILVRMETFYSSTCISALL